MRFLCASNLRLGRRISGLPDHLHLDPARLSTSTAWYQLVDIAIREEVDAVLLAGNVIDRENRIFEPIGPLEQGLSALERAGIPVIAVAGETDFDSLPIIAPQFRETIEVLDSDDWERVEIDDATIVGRSAPDASGRSGPPERVEDVTLVLLPASLTGGHAPDATFQPLSLDDLTTTGGRLWVLGSQREPDLVVQGATVVVEPGATCPLDPTDTGPRGVWIVDTDDPANAELLPISPVRFEDVDVDVSGATTLEEVESRTIGVLQKALDRCIAEDRRGQLLCVTFLLTLTGRTGLHHELPMFIRDLVNTLDLQRGGTVAAISAADIDTRPDIDLKPLLNRPDPVGELARLITSIEADDGKRSQAQSALIQRTLTRLQAVHRARVFAAVGTDPEPEAELAQEMLRRESWNVLDALVRQRGVDA